MPKAKNKTKGSETNTLPSSEKPAIPQNQLPKGTHRPIPWDSFVYDNGNFSVNTTLRKSQVQKKWLLKTGFTLAASKNLQQHQIKHPLVLN